jgi:cytochrome c553
MRRAWLLLGVLATGCAVDFQGWAGMKEQPKALPYRENAFFEDARAMRVPPPGTVSRDRRRQGNPRVLTREAVEAGGKSFDIYCAACHGLRGDGVSPVARNLGVRAPPSLLELPVYPDSHYYTVITEGFGVMPGYAEKLSVQQRWAVVAYVRALQASQRVPLAEVSPEAREQLEGTP